MNGLIPDPSRTALLLCDLQNDFLHPEGAYGRAGLGSPEIAALPERLAPLTQNVFAPPEGGRWRPSSPWFPARAVCPSSRPT
ncbi:MAG: hypothetical protein RML45_10010 [Acetobacteraceae bacterium]|nr:hypothetical protein [Acetobacteraceae bacterium]